MKSKKIGIVFVHGLGSKAVVWNKIIDLLKKDINLKDKFVYYCYDYPTHKCNYFKKLPNINQLSNGLESFINLKCIECDIIIIVGHSMGGLIARKYILDYIKRKKQPSLKVQKLILYSTPNNGSGFANLGTFFNPRNKQLQELSIGSGFLDDLNEDWHSLGLISQIDSKYIIAGLDDVVDVHSAKQYWGNNNTYTNINKNHRNIVEPTNNQDISFIILKSAINDLIEKLNQDGMDTNLDLLLDQE